MIKLDLPPPQSLRTIAKADANATLSVREGALRGKYITQVNLKTDRGKYNALVRVADKAIHDLKRHLACAEKSGRPIGQKTINKAVERLTTNIEAMRQTLTQTTTYRLGKRGEKGDARVWSALGKLDRRLEKELKQLKTLRERAQKLTPSMQDRAAVSFSTYPLFPPHSTS